MLITIEGPDKIGKSSVIKELFEMTGDRTIFLSDPGTTETGLQCRKIIKKIEKHPMADFALFLQAKQELSSNLREDEVYISDRYNDSTIVYQSLLLDIDQEEINNIINKFITVQPEITFILDGDKDIIKKRMIEDTNVDYMEKQIENKIENIIDRYRALKYLFPERKYVYINVANKTPKEIQEEIVREAKFYLFDKYILSGGMDLSKNEKIDIIKEKIENTNDAQEKQMLIKVLSILQWE